MAKQVVDATIVGTITGSGNAKITVTASGMTGSPRAISVPVVNGDSDSDVAYASRYALATDLYVSNFFSISGAGAHIVLTCRADAANDTTMNIASANDTCSGLTNEPTSTITTQGAVVITNGYITLDDFHNLARIDSTKTSDDASIAMLIEAASRYIDNNTSRRFYLPASDVIHYFDTPGWERIVDGGNYTGLFQPVMAYEPKLRLDDDFYSITSVTNGDGTVLTLNTDYVLLPYNATPYYEILLTGNAQWKPATNSNPVRCIQVAGKNGYCPIANVPYDIKEATYMISKAAYNRRFGENVTTKAVITPGGMVITPEDVPSKAMDIIYCHLRVSFG